LVGYLVIVPIVLVVLLAQLLVNLGWFIARLIGLGASELAERSQPARSAALDWGAALGKSCLTGLAFGVKWIVSAKDDVLALAEDDRDVNPVSLFAKLLVIVTASVFSLILIINLVFGASD
jgi:hypothetical protein